MDNLDIVKAVIADLNEVCGTNYRPTTRLTIRYINARLADNYTLDDFKKVHRVKFNEWNGTRFQKYLRPTTLYLESNFENYLQQSQQKPIKKRDAIDDFVDAVNAGRGRY